MENDKRFAKIAKDPRFQKMKKRHRKVKIDSRFQRMFTDKRFHTKFSADKRGKPLLEEESEDLHKFYELDDEKDSDEKRGESGNELLESEKPKINNKLKKGKKVNARQNVAFSSDSDDEEVDYNDIRGESKMNESSSSDEDDGEYNNDIDDEIVHGWGELDENTKRIENAESTRLAVCNCDWDKVTATDLYVLFNSFKPTNGVVKSVTIYSSDFGIERMRDEDMNGPRELKETQLCSDEEDDETGEGAHYHMEKLREYQLNRMKYYYAVVMCDSKETAGKLYAECDGMEYEMSATRMDLRFIPEDMTFNDRDPKSTASEMPSAIDYKPEMSLNTALQQSAVRLTWDETDPKRVQKTMRQFKQQDVDEMDFKDYLASSSEDENIEVDDKEQHKVDKYKMLLKEIEGKDEQDDVTADGNIDVVWQSQGDTAPLLETEVSQEDNDLGFDDPFFKEPDIANNKKTKKKRKKNNEEELTEEETKQKAQLELLMMDDSEERKHFNMRDIIEQERLKKKKKNRRRKMEEGEDGFKVDVNDPRFDALYTSHLYSIDPSQPMYKKTKAMDAIIEEGQRRRTGLHTSNETMATGKQNEAKASLSSLVKSIKAKSNMHLKRKKLK